MGYGKMDKKIQQALTQILSVSTPTRVILFGSAGRGEANSDSDIDLMVVEPNLVNRHAEIVRLRSAIGPLGTGMDLLVYSEAEVETRKDWCTSPIYWALREGKVLYEAA